MTDEDEHERLRAAAEAVKSEVSDLNGRFSSVQLNFSTTADQALILLEAMITESRKALDAGRGESLMALQTAMAKHESDLRGLYDTLVGQVRHALLGVRAELDATQAGRLGARWWQPDPRQPHRRPQPGPHPRRQVRTPFSARTLGRALRAAPGLVPPTLLACGPAPTTSSGLR